jgi:hypothetical protein
MIRPIRLLTFFLLCCVSLSFAGPSGVADSSAVSVSESPRVDPVEKALEQEILLRDSLMQVQGEACTAEKDSLRAVIETEKAKSENWEKSYNTVKGSNETCAQALSVSLGVNEKKKEDVEKERQSAAMMTSTSFLGGIGIGLLIMWLIMK